MKRLDFSRFVESSIVHMRLEHKAEQENPLTVRQRIDKELAVMIDDLMEANHNFDRIGKQMMAMWQGYMMALSSKNAFEDPDED